MAEDVVLPAAPPQYDIAVELASHGSTAGDGALGGYPDNATSATLTLTEEEARAMPVLLESRWLMDDLTVEGAESLLKMCGGHGSFVITNTDNPDLFLLFCRQAKSDGSVDKVDRISIKRESEEFVLEGQSPRPSLPSVAALFLHLSPLVHCPMFVNRETFAKFGQQFRETDSGWVAHPSSPNPSAIDLPHNPMNMNDWYFPALTNEQANYMLNQHGTPNCFVVSNMGITEHYEMTTRQKYEGVDQEIVEHLRITYDPYDKLYQIAGDVSTYPSLPALVASYRQSNPHMKPLFERMDGDGLSPPDIGENSSELVPPDYSIANTLPNPDAPSRLPQVAPLTISEPGGPSNGFDDPIVTPPSTRANQQNRPSQGRPPQTNTGNREQKSCCSIL